MVDINKASIEEGYDEDLADDLDKKGFSIDLNEVASNFIADYKKSTEKSIIDSAQESIDESKKSATTVKKIEKKKGDIIEGTEKIDYRFFSLPEDSEKYSSYVNQKNIKVKNTVEKLKDDGTLIIHTFSTKVDLVE